MIPLAMFLQAAAVAPQSALEPSGLGAAKIDWLWDLMRRQTVSAIPGASMPTWRPAAEGAPTQAGRRASARAPAG
jgi:hypothetical protein